MKLGAYIAMQRGMAGLSQKDLSLKVGVMPAVISRWETCRFNPSAKHIVKLAEIFRVDTEEMFKKRLKKEVK